MDFTPFYISNADFNDIKNKRHKINSRNFTYDGLTFSSSNFIFEEVKDEIWKHNGRSCFSIQDLVSFIMFMEELASLVLNWRSIFFKMFFGFI